MLNNQDRFNVKFTLHSAFEAIKWFKAQIQYILHPESIQKGIETSRTLVASKNFYDAYKALKGNDRKSIGKNKQKIDEDVIEDETVIDDIDENKTKDQILKEKEDLIDLYEEVSTFEVGKMYLFHYDPKTKERLPYYDTFPLILMMGFVKDGFYGINLHYLPVEARQILLSNLLTKAVLKGGELDRLRISYDIVKNVTEFKLFRPCFKRYLKTHIRSVIKEIPPKDWGYAVMLPIENFKKASKQQVWKNSMDSLN